MSSSHLCDVNVWLALTISGHHKHEPTAAWLDAVREPDAVLFCRSTQQSLLRLLSTGAVLAPYGNPPLTNREAWSIYHALTADERITLAAEPPGLQAHWENYATRDTASPKLWADAYLAAFARAGGHRLVTTDHDYEQFPDLDLNLL